MSVSYDRVVLMKYASKLYAQANALILLWALILGLAGGVAGKVVSPRFTDWTGVGFVVGLMLGAVFGVSRAFILKVEAQKIMCQVEIESHLDSLSEPLRQQRSDPPGKTTAGSQSVVPAGHPGQ